MSHSARQRPAGVQSPVHYKNNPSLSKEKTHQHRQNAKKFSLDKRAKRRNILTNELSRYGLALREDSKLCQRFIGGENLSIQFIAQVLHEMDHLAKHTAYPELMNLLVQEHRRWCVPHEQHNMEADVYAKISVQAKHIALSDNNCSLIEHCVPGYCIASEIGSNQIVLPTPTPDAIEYVPQSVAV